MDEITPYMEAKVVLAAVVLAQFREKKSPDVNSISKLSTFSVEKVHHIVKRLEEIGAVKRLVGPFDDKVVIQDESAIEQLKGEEYSANIEDEVADFAEKQKSKMDDIKSLFGGKGDEKKKDLKASLEDQIKSGGKTKKENPLDALAFGKKKGDDEDKSD